MPENILLNTELAKWKSDCDHCPHAQCDSADRILKAKCPYWEYYYVANKEGSLHPDSLKMDIRILDNNTGIELARIFQHFPDYSTGVSFAENYIIENGFQNCSVSVVSATNSK